MKIIVLGLGNFGMALASYLAETSNEVIATDIDMEKIDMIKDKVSHAVALDVTHENAYNALPLKHTDLAIVAVGQDNGVNIKATAIIKKLTNARVVSRSSSAIEDTIFEAMGVDQIIHPEQEYAEKLTKKFNLRGSIDNFEIDVDYSVSEVPACSAHKGKSIMEVSFRKNYNLNIITILRKKKFTNFIDRSADKQEVIGMPKPDTVFMDGDILVVFGTNKAIENYLEKTGIATEE